MNKYLLIGIIGAIVFILAVLFIIIKIIINKSKGSFYSQSKNVEESLGYKLKKLFTGRIISDEILDKLEEVLISSDIGPKIAYNIIDTLKKKNIKSEKEALEEIKKEIAKIIFEKDLTIEKGSLNILLILGVNGVGKTTTIAKISNYYLQKGLKVLLAAGDTFRAAASEQLSKWANSLNIPIIKQHDGADPASVVFDAIDSAKAKKVDLLIVDTAGRLHNKKNLMDELFKIDKIIQNKGFKNSKKNILVLDATTGQNAYQQTFSFNDLIGVDGIVLTKYDAQPKGGIVIRIQNELKIPFYFVGNGEKINNLIEFNKDEFIKKILF